MVTIFSMFLVISGVSLFVFTIAGITLVVKEGRPVGFVILAVLIASQLTTLVIFIPTLLIYLGASLL